MISNLFTSRSFQQREGGREGGRGGKKGGGTCSRSFQQREGEREGRKERRGTCSRSFQQSDKLFMLPLLVVVQLKKESK